MEHMELFAAEKISDRLTKIMVPGGVAVYLAEGDERALVIDSGCGYGPLRAFIETLTDKPYEVALTHGHLDHAGGAAQFERLWLDEKDAELVQIHLNPEMRAGYVASEAGEIDKALLDPAVPVSRFVFYEEGIHTFDLGGMTVQLIPMNGHTAGCRAALFVEDRILLTGDACCSITLLALEGSLTVEEYRENLEKFLESTGGKYDTMLYSHPHNKGGIQIVPEMIELCTEIMEGKDDRFVPEGNGDPRMAGCAAKKIGANILREDGKYANLIYNPERIRK